MFFSFSFYVLNQKTSKVQIFVFMVFWYCLEVLDFYLNQVQQYRIQ